MKVRRARHRWRTLKPPAIPETPPPVLSQEQIAKLRKACDGRTFADRRDIAIVRLFIDTGMRLAELATLRTQGLDLEQDVALVVWQGGRSRACPFRAKTAQALDRYLRVRAAHRMATRPQVWLGLGGSMTDSGIRQIITERAKQAGTGHLHPYRLRHTLPTADVAVRNDRGRIERVFETERNDPPTSPRSTRPGSRPSRLSRTATSPTSSRRRHC